MVVVRFDEKDLARLLADRRLGVGYRVRVRIITAEKSDALVVPRSALFRSTAGDWQVFVVRSGRAGSESDHRTNERRAGRNHRRPLRR